MSAKKSGAKTYKPVDAKPFKGFFVDMLTRDISLTDAILDLLDNCVDGILRKKRSLTGERPYQGFYADINFSKDSFEIADNCGGIPLKLHDYAFRMGRPDRLPTSPKGTVGTYGIGMKRAVFKLGRWCLISSKSGQHNYDVEITPEWLKDENEWEIPVVAAAEPMDKDGTRITVGDLHDGVASQFGPDRKSFTAEFTKQIETHYAFIIAKGFRVNVNGERIPARPTKLIFDTSKDRKAIRPYVYRTKVDGVSVFLAVGFTRPIPSKKEAQDEWLEEPRYSSTDAGWTVVCNDRAVLYGDKTELTGWGTSTVPSYHNQFIAISGIVEFWSEDPNKLPTTTTKRGIDMSSPLYIKTLDRMREGMKKFTTYTNWWKTDVRQAKEHIRSAESLTFEEIKKKSSKLPMKQARLGLKGRYHIPDLPKPKSKGSKRRLISFTRNIDEIRTVAEFLFDDAEKPPMIVGERCFDSTLTDAKK